MTKRHKVLSEDKACGKCYYCGSSLLTKNGQPKRKQKYCSEKCQQTYYAENYYPSFVAAVRERIWCEDCLQEIIYRLGAEVHHIIPISAGGAIFSKDNALFLCWRHHKYRHHR